MSKGAQTRQRIVARAAAVFNTQGFAGTSMSDLTQAAGIEKGGIYNHFASKEELALAAFDYATEQMTQRFAEAMRGAEDAGTQLEALIAAFGTVAENPPVPGGCPLLNTAIEADDTQPALRERARTAMQDLLRLIGGTVKRGIAAGTLHPETDPRAVATLVVATLEGAVMLSKLYDDPSYMRHAVEHLQSYIRTLRIHALPPT